MYNLEMWDSGERYLHKFDYILSACVKNCDVILFFFSITDRYDAFKRKLHGVFPGLVAVLLHCYPTLFVFFFLPVHYYQSTNYNYHSLK